MSVKDCGNCKHLDIWGDTYPCVECIGDEGDADFMWEAQKATRGFERVSEKFRTVPDEDFRLPLRGTSTSAGYDFVATEDLTIRPGETVMFKTDVKAFMSDEEVLLMTVRSSLGFKHGIALTNTMGVIDSDYFNNPENDGNIGIGLRNMKPAVGIGGFSIYAPVGVECRISEIPTVKDLTEENTVRIKKGDRVCQGIFVVFKESGNCNTEVERVAGSGSTGHIGGKGNE